MNEATLLINGIPSPGLVEITEGPISGIDYGITPGVVTYSGSFDCTIGIRAWRLLSTGRPRPKRTETKQRNRQRREIRQSLVRWSGDNRRHDRPFPVFDDVTPKLLRRRVSIPRSLRHVLGRWVVGAQ